MGCNSPTRIHLLWPHGGIGRHIRLKICCSKGRPGSIPGAATTIFMADWTKGKLGEPLVLETNVLESSNLSSATISWPCDVIGKRATLRT